MRAARSWVPLLLGGILLAGLAIGDPWSEAPGPTPSAPFVHAAYHVEVQDGTQWRSPDPADGVPEHWEWRSSLSATVDGAGHPVATTAYEQMLWWPEAHWTDQWVTHVNRNGIVRQDTVTFAELPFRSDVGVHHGPLNLELMTVGPVASNQTIQASRFQAESPLPCGYATERHGGRLTILGSCTPWPEGTPSAHDLAWKSMDRIDERRFDRFAAGDLTVWIAEDAGVPWRIESGEIRLTLVGLVPNEASAPQATLSSRDSPWTQAPRQPWGLDESSIAVPFGAAEAYQAALTQSAPDPLAVFLLLHPDAVPYRVHGWEMQAGDTRVKQWDFVIADDEAAWIGNVTQETRGAYETVLAFGAYDAQAPRPKLPFVADVPGELPSLQALVERWAAWTGEEPSQANVWTLDVSCAVDCSSAKTQLSVGRELWAYPTQTAVDGLTTPLQYQGTTHVMTFTPEGGAVGSVESDWRTSRHAVADLNSQDATGHAAVPQRLFGIASEQGQVVAGAALLLGLAALLSRIVPIGIGLYARIRTDDLPDHPKRAAILDLVSATPGLRYSDLLRMLACGKGTLEHHLGALERSGHLVRVKRNGLSTYYRTQQDVEGDAMAWLRSTTARRILGLLALRDARTADVHRLVGCSRTPAYVHLVKLEKAGLIQRAQRQAMITDAGRAAWLAVRGLDEAGDSRHPHSGPSSANP